MSDDGYGVSAFGGPGYPLQVQHKASAQNLHRSALGGFYPSRNKSKCPSCPDSVLRYESDASLPQHDKVKEV